MRFPLTCLVVSVIAACAPAPDADPPPVAPPVVTFQATDFAFTGPGTIPAGHTTIRMEAAAEAEMHHVQLVKLDGGRTVADLMAALAEPGPLPDWAELHGGPNAVAPGGVSEAVVELTEGGWAAICVIPGPGGLHVAQGMVHTFTVTANPAPAPAPDAHLVMTLSDYTFAFSAPPTAGTHTIRVENTGSQPHEVVLARLDEGKTVQDLVDFIVAMEAGGPPSPPPGMPIGGVTNFNPGVVNWFTATLTPGEYAIVCVFPDTGDGRPHMFHGMMHQFTIPS